MASVKRRFVSRVYTERGGKARPPGGIPVEFLATGGPRSTATAKTLLRTGLKILKSRIVK